MGATGAADLLPLELGQGLAVGQRLALQGQLRVPLLLSPLLPEPPHVPLQLHLLHLPGASQLLQLHCEAAHTSGAGREASARGTPQPCKLPVE